MCVLCMHMGKLLKIQTKWNNKHITKSRLFKYIETFTTKKKKRKIFRNKSDFSFYIFLLKK